MSYCLLAVWNRRVHKSCASNKACIIFTTEQWQQLSTVSYNPLHWSFPQFCQVTLHQICMHLGCLQSHICTCNVWVLVSHGPIDMNHNLRLIAGCAQYSPTIQIHLKEALIGFCYLFGVSRVFKSYELVSLCTVGLFVQTTSSKCIPLRNRLIRDGDRHGLQFFLCENWGCWSWFQLLGNKSRRMRGGWCNRLLGSKLLQHL